MRDNVSDIVVTSAVPRRPLTATPRRSLASPPAAVGVRGVAPAALAIATKLADGDLSRLRFLDDGTVLVANVERPGCDPRATR